MRLEDPRSRLLLWRGSGLKAPLGPKQVLVDPTPSTAPTLDCFKFTMHTQAQEVLTERIGVLFAKPLTNLGFNWVYGPAIRNFELIDNHFLTPKSMRVLPLCLSEV